MKSSISLVDITGVPNNPMWRCSFRNLDPIIDGSGASFLNTGFSHQNPFLQF